MHSVNPFAAAQTESNFFRSVTDEELRKDEFWSLRDVSFELRRGECLGLIGHNGAGKSTLLKILNGLIRPDSGRITMRGRVAAMIELNAGFNGLLTGRENIYNQGALLGFSRTDIERQFDAIVEFSELEQFLDTPVQNYSSGMKVKLGFAVSTQLQPDILLIDEVLAVGDLGFRFKCLNRISSMMRQCAVIFVSHSMTQVMRVSTEVIMLKEGRVAFRGPDVAAGLEQYYGQFRVGGVTSTGSLELRVDAMSVRGSSGQYCELGGTISVRHLEQLTIELSVGRNCEDIHEAVVQVLFWNNELSPVLDIMGKGDYGQLFAIESPRTDLQLRLPPLPLNSGNFSMSVILTAPGLQRVYCQADQAAQLQVKGGSPESGASCVLEGDWRQLSGGLSLAAKQLLHKSSFDGRKLSAADGLLFDELRPGDIAIDCGANVGVISCEMARRGALVHAFEPDPVAFAELQRRTAEFSGVTLHQMAVSSAEGTLPLFFRHEREEDAVAYSVGSTLLAEKTDVRADQYCNVRVVRLAEFIQRFDRIRLLKMDIEGAECDVLEDLLKERLLERCDLVLVETHEEWIPQSKPRLDRIRQQLTDLKYDHVCLNWV
ncbi:MAG: FkbM family methyltransferase [Planctomycetaceae bacterium]